MKAWVLEDVGDIQYKEAAKPHISENEVLVAVKAAVSAVRIFHGFIRQGRIRCR